jgi:glycine/D-amino acid oxidase-like deaminating enzyme
MRALIIGAGIIGCAVARELASRGVDVELLDRSAPGSATSAHCEGNVLLSDKSPGPELELAQLSRRLWPQIIASIRDQCGDHTADLIEWEPKGGIVVATTPPGATVLDVFTAEQADAGVVSSRLTSAEVHAAEPYLTRDLTAAYHYPDDAQVQPVAAAHAFLRQAKLFGAKVFSGVGVMAPLIRAGQLVGVETTSGKRYADAVIDSAGPWSSEVSDNLGAPIAILPRRGDILVTTPQPPTVFHKVYDADYVTTVGSDSAGLQTSAVIESTRAGTILIGSSRRRAGLDIGLRMDSLEQIAQKAIRLYPRLADIQVVRAYGGFRPYVADHLPVIGPDPRLPGLWHATGHEGNGIGLSVGSALLLADCMLGEPNHLARGPFRVNRSAVVDPIDQAAS